MTREEAIQWLKVINTKKFGWDKFALQESQREIRERCEQGVREAIDMAIEALSANLKEEFESAEVVRCKDCRHGEHIQIPLWENRDIDKAPSQFHDFIKCHKLHIKGFNETLYLGDDDYCSHGERKQDD